MSKQLPEVQSGLCYHCLQPLPQVGVIFHQLAGQPVSLCCYGCQAVASTIEAHNLLHFYQFRDTSNPLQVPLLPDELQELKAYDDERLQQQLSHAVDDGREITLSVEGMTCSACAWLIERELEHLNGLLAVRVNATTERVTVRWQPAQIQLSVILQTIAGLGYRALPFQAAQQEADFKRRRRYFVNRLGVAGLATMQVMMIAVGLYFGVVSDLEDSLRQFLWWISLLFATPVLLYSAQPFYLSALRSIQARQPNMDVPVSLALLGAYGASAYATLTNQGEVYFESVSMFTFFLLAGRYLELLAKQKAMSHAANLIKLLPAITHRETSDGSTESIPVHQLTAGDIIHVPAGSTIPVDGELLDHSAQLNESLLTGESRLQTKSPSATVLAGSIPPLQSIRMRVTAIQQQTVLASIIALQDTALSRKPKLAATAETLANKFVIRLLILAGATFLVWSFIDPQQAFWVTLAVLVATCPCALALAAPTAITGAIHRLNRAGIIVRNADVFTKVEQAKTLLIDKTGTLTTGDFKLVSWRNHQPTLFSDAQLRALTQDLEREAVHPYALCLSQWGSTRSTISKNWQWQRLEQVHGAGVCTYADVTKNCFRIGSLAWIQEWHPDFVPENHSSQVFLVNPHQVLAEFELQDELRSGIQTTLFELEAVGLQIIMLTGDREDYARDVAARLGIETIHSQCMPADKLRWLEHYQAQGPVIMLGDGLNDGPVLAQADIAITFSQAADLARIAADVILVNHRGESVANFRTTALRCRNIMNQNIRWALLYNVIIIPIAVAGFLTPYMAAIGMSASSLLVLLNSLRLYR
ncbi:MAG TPA: heavy metal translocating P-type ATPase metal-binding domain-containing protein [Pseudidiomarina sp.]|nr:heavy metal translocating P-type ATPase metal-binding domain-containing protein [Pseudidiomarina sp.]